ncbi:cytochrome P450 [Streptomyces sp. NPDC020875]|uniref:cytochrome P450 n=1 Tax=Streptomyces sp. NPDC020875 TaxID=3154898 RepID=UPI0033D5C8FA
MTDRSTAAAPDTLGTPGAPAADEPGPVGAVVRRGPAVTAPVPEGDPATADRADAGRTADDSAAGGGAVPLLVPADGESPATIHADLRRRHGRVAPVVAEDGGTAWLVLGYAEVGYVTAHEELFVRDTSRPGPWPEAAEGTGPAPVAPGRGPGRPGPSAARALAAVDQFELAEGCRGVARRLVDGFAGSGRAELMSAYVRAVSLRAAVLMCGLPPDAGAFEGLVGDLQTALAEDGPAGCGPAGTDAVRDGTHVDRSARGGGDELRRSAYVRAGERLRRLVAARRSEPRPDVISRLLADPAAPDDGAVVREVLGLVAAAHRPTADWIGNALRLLLTDERFARDVSGGRLSVGQALNEVLWLDTPAQTVGGRRAVRDTQLGGHRVRAGDRVLLSLAAANTDPQIWPGGRPGGENAAHLSFGGGGRRCPYPAPLLAESIARTAVETLLERLPDTVLAVDPERLAWRPSVRERGLVALPVRFTPVVR